MLGGRLAMRGAEVGELVEQPLAAFGLKLGEDRAGGEGFEVADGIRQLRAGDDGVEVVVEDDPGVEAQSFVLPAVLEGADEDVATRACSLARQPPLFPSASPVVKTGSHSMIVEVMKCAASGSRMR